MHFSLYALRFPFIARRALRFPAGRAANQVRGSLGAALRSTSPEAYARLFAPRAEEPGPSGLVNRPRPFALRVAHLEGAEVHEGCGFHVGLNLFDLRPDAVSALEAAFAQWDLNCALTGVEGAYEPLVLPLDPAPEPVRRVRVRFLTPTELKGAEGEIAEGESKDVRQLPAFRVLAARVRDRIGTLRALYGDGPLAIDFRAFGERAGRVRTAGGSLQEVAAQRRSRSTGQVHSLGGFVGEVEYEGDLAEFLPYLRAAAYTGVGRQTVWGKGEISVERVH